MDEVIDAIERDNMWKFSDPSKGGQPIDKNLVKNKLATKSYLNTACIAKLYTREIFSLLFRMRMWCRRCNHFFKRWVCFPSAHHMNLCLF